MEEERRRAEDERRRAEEQRKIDEERRREEERRIEEQRLREERRLAEEQRKLEEERRREEERRLNEQRRFTEERRRQDVERERAEDALKIIGEQQRRQKPNIQVKPVVTRPSYKVRFEAEDRQRSPLTVKVDEPEVIAQRKDKYFAAALSPSSSSPRRESPREVCINLKS